MNIRPVQNQTSFKAYTNNDIYRLEQKIDQLQAQLDDGSLQDFYKDLPKSMDIKGVKRPFRVIPLPKFITNLRIRCSISLILNTQEYIGNLYILDATNDTVVVSFK